ncbi:cytochrome c oxidase subunit 8 [Anticarsia gemmatalis]|uniref:cytochrome c oxidase subunit 8 n=1 Tax=Anticarsia gemmatalis TaxID=129554 RepID=UPI003F76F151
MFAIRSLLRTNPQVFKNVAQARNMSAIATPARNKVTTGEMVVLSAVMVIGWSAIPAWVLVNIKNYRVKE